MNKSIVNPDRQYMWIRSENLLSTDHDEICQTLVENGVNGVVALPSTYKEWYYPTALFPQSNERINGQHVLPHFIETARSHDLNVFLWLCVGKWQRFREYKGPMTPMWNADNDPLVKNYNDDGWLNLTRSDVREAVVDVAREQLELLDIDGILLDYIRFQPGNQDLHPHVTRTVLAVRGMMKTLFPDKELLATCFRAHSPTGKPPYQNVGQYWLDWLEDDMVDHVFATLYKSIDDMRVNLAGLPADSRVTAKVRPTGQGSMLVSPAEFRRMLEIVEDVTLFKASVWHYGIMNEDFLNVYREFKTRWFD